MRGIVVIASALLVVVACGRVEEQQRKYCSVVGCGSTEGIDVEFAETAAGAYRVEGDVDGKAFSCTATLPLPDAGGLGRQCSGATVSLLVGPVDGAPQTVGHLVIYELDAKSVTVRVQRDGTLIHAATFAPTYTETPGPNGPDCDPPTCRNAMFALP